MKNNLEWLNGFGFAQRSNIIQGKPINQGVEMGYHDGYDPRGDETFKKQPQPISKTKVKAIKINPQMKQLLIHIAATIFVVAVLSFVGGHWKL